MASGRVDLVFCDTDKVAIPGAALADVLSAAELERAGRFRFPHLAQRYRIRRFLLRQTLAKRLGCAARDLRFSFGLQGKPWLPEGPVFNMSDSQSMVLIGVADEGNIGVDIEHLAQTRDLEGLAERYFAPAEIAELRSISGADRRRAFYRAWTRKEALIKALGGGLSIPLDSFSVSLAETSGSALLSGGELCDVDVWSVRSLFLDSDLEAAIAWDRELTEFQVQTAPLQT